jgi:DNA invertase Pin-like site-specific DNA recombinase
MTQAVGYIRVSTEEQADEGFGLEAQRNRITAYCQMKGLELEEVFEDAGISGGKPLAKRPAGNALLATVRKSKPVLVVAKMDRIFRSCADSATLIEEFERKDILLVSIAEGMDMTTPHGRAMAQMSTVFAQLERDMIRERTKDAMHVKRLRGERISRWARYGSEFTVDGMVVTCRDEQKVIRHIRQMRQSGMSLRKIADQLNEHSIKPKFGTMWFHCTVRSVLVNNP